ncbi:unnamed protein product [Pleuronectes platessa]|uniref:Uncharacterized protein n=1 Tax=Pleuronectes platessa TaxID=8262 RepID=A0A9N7UMF6_PLEPL|nr:unnamed protein product [Pleuronectes platessa]
MANYVMMVHRFQRTWVKPIISNLLREALRCPLNLPSKLMESLPAQSDVSSQEVSGTVKDVPVLIKPHFQAERLLEVRCGSMESDSVRMRKRLEDERVKAF